MADQNIDFENLSDKLSDAIAAGFNQAVRGANFASNVISELETAISKATRLSKLQTDLTSNRAEELMLAKKAADFDKLKANAFSTYQNATEYERRESKKALIDKLNSLGVTDLEGKSYESLLEKAKELFIVKQKENLIAEDLVDATDRYNKALRQVDQDLLTKELMLQGNLTEDEVIQQARLLLMQKKKQDSTAKLTKEEIEELKRKNQILRNQRQTLELKEAIAKYQLEINEGTQELSMTWKKIGATVKAILTDPALAKAIIFTSAIKGGKALIDTVKEFKEVGMTAGEAVNATLKSFSILGVVGYDKSAGILKSMTAEYGSLNRLSDDQLHTVGRMASSYNLAEEEALKLTMAVSRMPGQSLETAKNFSQTVDRVGKLKGVIPTQIMRDMAKNTENIAKYSRGGAEGFAKAAASARKMGIEIGDALSAAEKTLDFENSLTTQMEASAMIGKEINLDRLRYATLNGSSNDVLREQQAILAQIGDIDNMNLLKKRAIADAIGLSIPDLQKMSQEARGQTQTFGENSTSATDYAGSIMRVVEATGKLGSTFGPTLVSLVSLITNYRMINLLKTQNALLTGQENVQNNANTGGILRNVGARLSNIATSIKQRIQKFFTIQATNTETITTDQSTAAQTRHTLAMQRSGLMAKGAALGMLAFGGAIALIGVGIGAAAYGMSSLVASFKDLSGGEIAGALLGLTVIMGGFIGIILALGLAAGAAAPAVIAFGAGVALIGVGIGIAAYGMSLLVESFKELKLEQVVGATIGIVALSVAFYALTSAMIGLATSTTVATPALYALGVSVLMVGGGFMLMGMGIEKAVMSVVQLIAQLRQMPTLTSGLYELSKGLDKVADSLTRLGRAGLIAMPFMAAMRVTSLSAGSVAAAPPPSQGRVASATPATTAPATVQTVATTTAPTTQQAKATADNEARMQALMANFEELIKVFRKKDITLQIDSKVLHRELFDRNAGGRAGTNGLG